MGLCAVAAPAQGQKLDPAGARESEPAASSGQASGRRHFQAALEHYRARRYREAIHEFQLSIADLPSADVWFNIGRAHEQLGEYALAVEHYRLYLRDRVDAPDAAEVQRRITELQGHDRRARSPGARIAEPSGTLAIDVAEPGALVLLDGQELGSSPMERVLRVEPGQHRVEASRSGHIPFRSEVEVQSGALSVAYVQLRPRSDVPQVRSARLWTWITAGASAGALLASGALGLIALDRRDSGEWREARRLAVSSDLALGAGLALAIGATLLYFVEGEDDVVPPPRER